MKKVLKVIQIVALLLTIFEILAFGIFISLYVLDIWNLQTHMSVEGIGYLTIGIVIFNLIVLACFFMIINFNKTKNDLSLEEIVGKEINETFLFGEIGFLVFDNDNKIVWTSDIFHMRGVNVINQDVFEWNEELKEFLNEDDTFEKTIQIDDNFYIVKLLKNNNIFLFKDVTEYENAVALFQRNSLVLGIIMIDNYAEIAQNNEDSNDIIPQIKNAITNYARTFHFVIRSFKSDSFFVVSRNEDLENLKKDNFSILNTVRAIGKKEDVNTTLSIAFAHDFSTIAQNNEMASTALSIAMSRGGDQAVIAQMNHELIFFGGKSGAEESRNKVKVKSDANALLNHIETYKDNKIFIMGHRGMDMDALGSCLGIYEICKYKNCKDFHIVFDHTYTEKKTRYAFMTSFAKSQFDDMTISLKKAIDECDPTSLLIIVDVNRSDNVMCPELLDKTEKYIVIDHHRQSDTNVIDNPLLKIIDTSASSASELITELIKYGSKFPPIPVQPKVATIMLSGIFLDTQFFKTRTVGIRTFESSMVLKEYGADNYEADDFLKDEIQEFEAVMSIVENMITPFSGVVYCKCKDDEIIDSVTLAKAANQCLAIKGNSASFVIGRTKENEVGVSARSDGKINVQLICEKLGGGGHLNAAATAIKDTSVNEIEKRLVEVLTSTLDEARKNIEGED